MNITIEITALDNKILQDQIIDTTEWVESAVQGKIAACKTRLLKRAQEQLIADPDTVSIPASEDGVINAFFALPSYADRAAREVELEKARIKEAEAMEAQANEANV
jgi:hypothetical protein